MKYTIMIGNNRLSRILFSKELIIIFFLFPFFKTSGFDAFPGLSLLCNGLIFCEFILFFTLVLLEKKGNTFFFLIVAYEIWNYLLAPLLSGNEAPSIFYLSGTLGLLSLFILGFSYDHRRFLKALSTIFTIMIVVNLLLMIAFPEGLMPNADGNLYLFGLRVGFSLFIIPGLMFNCIYDDLNGKTSSKTVICFLVGTMSLLMQWVATGIVELTVILLWLVLSKFFRLKQNVNYAWISFTILAVNFLFTFTGTNNFILQILVLILNRDITLTGRTTIWEKTIDKLASAPLTGYGTDATVMINTVAKPAHNQWLHFAMEGGYVAMCIVLAAVLISSFILAKNKGKSWYVTTCAFFASILIGCIAEIQTYVPFFYAVFMLPILLKKYTTIEDRYGTANQYYCTSIQC